MNLKDATRRFSSQKLEYFNQWIFDDPIFVDNKHDNQLKKLQQVLYKLVCAYVENYQDYTHIMPLGSRTQEVLSIFSSKHYEPGNYRTDFVYDTDNQVKLIEITARFALNTQFLVSIFNTLAENYRQASEYALTEADRDVNLYDYLESIGASNNNIYVLQGDDLRNESKFFVPIFESMAKNVVCMNYKALDDHIDKLDDAWIISELALAEIESLSNRTLEKLAKCNLVNDFRTAFLIHDKRFFSVLSDKSFLTQFLSPDEETFITPYIVKTYSFEQHPEQWEDAKTNKDQWILKHRALGKSQSVFAGAVTDTEIWQELFNKEDIKDYILQEWVQQARFQGEIDNKRFDDYVTGTLMFFNNNYFGLGPYRLSSHPVTNVVDDRKAYSVVTDLDQLPTEIRQNSIVIY